VYLSLTSPEASQWNPKLKGYVRELRLFGVKQPFPSLIAAHRTFSDSEFEALLRACVVISMRYNIICGKSPNEQETVYASVAKKITQGEYSNASAALLGMKSIYPSDETFNASFTEKVMRARTPKMARYILCALEKQAGGQDYDFESDALSVEHIFPQNSKAGWDAFSDEEAEALVYRLGNMALLDKSANRDLGNAEFSVKKAAFAASHFQLTAKVASDNLDWTPVRIAMRQKQMAKLATAFWRIPQLS
jgi:Fe-S cluster biosynthesis and repair protein YggX